MFEHVSEVVRPHDPSGVEAGISRCRVSPTSSARSSASGARVPPRSTSSSATTARSPNGSTTRNSQATVVARGTFAHNVLDHTSTNLYTNVHGNVMTDIIA